MRTLRRRYGLSTLFRATTDIKHALTRGWYQAFSAAEQNKGALGLDMHPQPERQGLHHGVERLLRFSLEQFYSYGHIIVYGLFLLLICLLAETAPVQVVGTCRYQDSCYSMRSQDMMFTCANKKTGVL